MKKVFLMWFAVLFMFLSVSGCGGGGGSGGGDTYPVPKITDINGGISGSGSAGSMFIIDGSGFGSLNAADAKYSVDFRDANTNAVVAAVSINYSTGDWNDIYIKGTVPNGLTALTTYKITVTTAGGTSNAVDFLVGGDTYPVPKMTDINGGISGSGSVGSMFIIDGSGFGSLNAANALYSVDFRDANTNAVVATASTNYSTGDWNDIYIKGTVPNGLTALTTYKVTVTTAGGTSNAVDFLVVASVAFSPSKILWSQAPTLPAAQQGFPTVVAPIFKSMTSVTNNYIYTLGGKKVGGKNVDTVYYTQLDNATGALKNAPWAKTTPLPAKRGFSAASLANRFNSFASGYGTVYVLGGLDDQGNATDTVYYASLNADGTIGTWATTTKLPQALFAEGAVIFHGRIYVAGGNDSTGPVKSVYSAKINSDGTLGAWQTLPDMPIALAYHQLVTAAGYLYAIGGDSAMVDPLTNLPDASSQGDVYYNKINFLDGTLASNPWSKNTGGMGKNREKHTAVVVGGYVLVSGGLYNGATNGLSEQSYASINSDGSLASFNEATGTHTISGSLSGYNFYNHSSAYFVDDSGNPHVLILGGADAKYGTLHSEVWYQH